MKISGKTKVHDLLVTYPFLEDYLVTVSAKFEMLKNRMARATIGRLATLATAASIGGLELSSLIEGIADEIERRTGTRPELDDSGEPQPASREERVETLKAIIRDLHDGGISSVPRRGLPKRFAMWKPLRSRPWRRNSSATGCRSQRCNDCATYTWGPSATRSTNMPTWRRRPATRCIRT